ncbi:hypothetical protein PF002_g26378 [Phytophthora fragariae]|uniref:Uncharacterized protein n=1 Tax=Phytophthora fragariae TaxID=53985 RepID=A0A6A3WGC0_9STRA|nr:hypothetical protein PF009_g23795 [Phytophthora fragariae]KAE9184634.1 hypothetical protein PF002_g26378 [Phytophthora fragariae]KAE9279973.1 hypothetical protein PF001_g24450 [Phytophthora fragariae]
MASSGSNGSSSDAAKVTAPPTSPPVATRALGTRARAARDPGPATTV